MVTLISARFTMHCRGIETAELYARDAEQDGDEEATRFFKEVQERYEELSDRAKILLSKIS